MELSMPVVWSDRCLLHDPAAEIWVGTPTPATEIPARVIAIRDALDARVVDAQPQDDAALLAVHDEALLSVVPRRDPRDRTRPQILTGEAPDAVRIPQGCRFHPRCPAALPECRGVDPELRPDGADHRAACILVS